MFRFVARRVATSILLLVATSIVVFFVLRLLPGDPVITSLGASPGVSDATIARLRHEAGIDRPILAQYATWLTGALHGDLGKSYFSQYSVSSLISARLWPTFELSFLGVLLSILLAVPGALWAAHRPRGVIDTATGRGLDRLALAARLHRGDLPHLLPGRPDASASYPGLRAAPRRPGRQPQALRASERDPGAGRSAAPVPVPPRLAPRADRRGLRPHRARERDDRVARRAQTRCPELARADADDARADRRLHARRRRHHRVRVRHPRVGLAGDRVGAQARLQHPPERRHPRQRRVHPDLAARRRRLRGPRSAHRLDTRSAT